VYKDEERQMTFDAFLGVRGYSSHTLARSSVLLLTCVGSYREVHRLPPHCLTSYPALVLDPMPHIYSEQAREATALLRGHTVCWILPQGIDSVSVRLRPNFRSLLPVANAPNV
jgi:hypothetical protein